MLMICGCSSESKSTSESPTEVKIGNQIWMTENLNVETFRNGDTIPRARTNKEWDAARQRREPAWCYYDNDSTNGEIYGKLYNWFAVSDPRGLAPEGWAIPSDNEWKILIDYLGGEDQAGASMKSTYGWRDEGNGHNKSGFSAFPGGFRSTDGRFHFVKRNGDWWSSSPAINLNAWGYQLKNNNNDISRYMNIMGKGMSVRCLKN